VPWLGEVQCPHTEGVVQELHVVAIGIEANQRAPNAELES
jgi:hypothetical protein